MTAIDHTLHKATKAADVLKEQLQLIASDDTDLIRDCIEGEVDLVGAITMAAAMNLEDAAQVNAIKEIEDKLAARRDRYEKRIAHRRVAMLAAMQSGEIMKLETPYGTISRKPTPPTALILEEEKLPTRYWKPSDPKLDKKAILDDLKEGIAIPGAQLSNGGEALQIRL